MVPLVNSKLTYQSCWGDRYWWQYVIPVFSEVTLWDDMRCTFIMYLRNQRYTPPIRFLKKTVHFRVQNNGYAWTCNISVKDSFDRVKVLLRFCGSTTGRPSWKHKHPYGLSVWQHLVWKEPMWLFHWNYEWVLNEKSIPHLTSVRFSSQFSTI